MSERSLLQRINRALAKNSECVKTSRGARMEAYAGRFYMVETTRGVLLQRNINLEALGRELQVLKPWEQVVENLRPS